MRVASQTGTKAPCIPDTEQERGMRAHKPKAWKNRIDRGAGRFGAALLGRLVARDSANHLGMILH